MNDSVLKTLGVAFAICMVCSLIVSFAAVNLKSKQDVNKALDKQKNILQVAGKYYEGVNIQETFSSFEPLVVDIDNI